ncbi:MAG: LysM peptidoglycan-binding domain-containing protein [Pseudomonadota bacterium]
MPRYAVDALGYVTESLYDVQGNEIYTIRWLNPIGKLTEYNETSLEAALLLHNNVSIHTDANTRYRIYDELSQLRFQIDANGYATEMRYDKAGNVIEKRLYQQKIWQNQTNGVNQWGFNPFTLSLAELETTVELLEFSNERFVYDAFSQLRFSIDSNHYVKEYQYTNNKISKELVYLSYLGGIQSGEFSVEEMQDKMRSINNFSTSYIYDLSGNLRFSLDAENYLTERRYDSRGNLIELLEYQDKSLVTDQSTLAEFVELVTPGDAFFTYQTVPENYRHTQYVYNEFNQLVAKIDAENYVTSYDYDNLGNTIEQRQYLEPIEDNLLHKPDDNALEAMGRLSGVLLSNAQGKISAITSAIFDNLNRKLYEINAENFVTAYQYDKNGRVTQEIRYQEIPFTGDMPRSQVKTEAAMKNLLAESQGIRTHYVYDAVGQLRYQLDAENYLTEHRYNHQGLVVETLDYQFAGQFSTSVSLQDIESFLNSTNSIGRIGDHYQIKQYDYDELGQLIRERPSSELEFVYHYDAKGNMVRKQDIDSANAVTRETLFIYDQHNQKRFQVNAEGYATEWRYDALGQIVQKSVYKNINLNVSSNMDMSSIQQNLHSFKKSSEYYIYDNLGQKRFIIDAEGYVTENQFDGYGHLITIKHYHNNIDRVGLNVESMITLLIDNPYSQTEYQFNAIGQQIARRDQKGYYEYFTYDALGNKTHYTNKLGNQWHYQYDKLNQLIQETMPPITYRDNGVDVNAHIINTYEYDAFGNLIKEIKAKNTRMHHQTLYEYDKLNRKIKTILPIQGQIETDGTLYIFGHQRYITYSYNAFDQLIKQSDYRFQNGRAVDTYYFYNHSGLLELELLDRGEIDLLDRYIPKRFEYDAFGNKTQIEYYGIGLESFESWHAHMDSKAALALIEQAKIEASSREDNLHPAYLSRFAFFNYDKLGRLTSANGYLPEHGSNAVFFEYDGANNLTYKKVALSVNSDEWAEEFFYYSERNELVATVNAEKYLTAMVYDAEGRVIKKIEHAGQLQTSIDKRAIPTIIGVSSGPINPDRVWIYHYDAVGNQIQVSRENITAADSYGNWIDDAQFQIFNTYDAEGNKIQTYHSGWHKNLETFHYNALNQLTDHIKADISVPGSHLTDDADSPLGHPFSNQHHLLANRITNYSYDAMGNLVREKTFGEWTENTKAWFESHAHAIPDTLGDERIIERHFDRHGNVLLYIDAEGNQTFSIYSTNNELIKESIRVDQRTNFGNIGTTDDRVDDYTIQYRYDYQGRLINQIKGSPDILATPWEEVHQLSIYNTFGELIAKGTKARHLRHNFEYLPIFEHYDYDDRGNQIHTWSHDRKELIIKRDYDDAGRVLSELWLGEASNTNDDRITTYSYNRLGQVIEEQKPRFIAVEYKNPLSFTDWSSTEDLVSPLITRSYDRWGNVVRENTSGATTYYGYDHDNRLIEKQGAGFYILNEAGQSRFFNPFEYYFYGQNGNLQATRNTRGDLSLYRYTQDGQLQHAYDAQGHMTYHLHNIFGELVGKLEGQGTLSQRITEYRHDKNGNIIKQIVYWQENGNDASYIQQWGYDNLNRKIYHIRGEQVVWGEDGANTDIYYYNHNNQVVAHHSANNNIINNTYDYKGNKLTEIKTIAGDSSFEQKTAWKYDYFSNRLLAESSEGTKKRARTKIYEYNAFGQVISEDFYWRNLLIYISDGYSQGGSEEPGGEEGPEGGEDFGSWYLQTLPKSQQIHYTYNRAGLVISKSDLFDDFEELKYTTHMKYDIHGQVVSEIIERSRTVNNTTTDYSFVRRSEYIYDSHGRLRNLKASRGFRSDDISAEISRQTISYDEAGNKRGIFTIYKNSDDIEQFDSNYYEYDKNQRLILSKAIFDEQRIVATDDSVKITYDALGRRQTVKTWTKVGDATSHDREAETQIFRYNGRDQILRVDTEKLSFNTSDATPIYDSTSPNNTQVFGFVMPPEITENIYNAVGQLLYTTTTIRHSHNSATVGDEKSLTFYDYYLTGRLKSTLTQKLREYINNGISNWRIFNQIDVEHTLESGLFETLKTVETTNTSYNAQGDVIDIEISEFIYTTEGWDHGKKLSVKVTSQQNQIENMTKTLDYSYDSTGKLIAEIDTDIDSDQTQVINISWYTYDASNNLVVQYTGQNLSDPFQHTDRIETFQDYFYHQGQIIGSIGSLEAARFDFNIDPKQKGSANNSEYIVRQGDTLRSIAFQLYGNAKLWYVIANANGLSSADNLQVGIKLMIPPVLNYQNSADTFNAYSPAALAGSQQSPILQATPLEQPPSQDACQRDAPALAAAIISAVVSAYTGGLFPSTAGGQFASGALSSSLGNLSGQLVHKAIDPNVEIDGNSIFKSALSGGFTAGVGQNVHLVNRALTTGAINQVINSGNHGVRWDWANYLSGVAGNITSSGVQPVLGVLGASPQTQKMLSSLASAHSSTVVNQLTSNMTAANVKSLMGVNNHGYSVRGLNQAEYFRHVYGSAIASAIGTSLGEQFSAQSNRWLKRTLNPSTYDGEFNSVHDVYNKAGWIYDEVMTAYHAKGALASSASQVLKHWDRTAMDSVRKRHTEIPTLSARTNFAQTPYQLTQEAIAQSMGVVEKVSLAGKSVNILQIHNHPDAFEKYRVARPFEGKGLFSDKHNRFYAVDGGFLRIPVVAKEELSDVVRVPNPEYLDANKIVDEFFTFTLKDDGYYKTDSRGDTFGTAYSAEQIIENIIYYQSELFKEYKAPFYNPGEYHSDNVLTATEYVFISNKGLAAWLDNYDSHYLLPTSRTLAQRQPQVVFGTNNILNEVAVTATSQQSTLDNAYRKYIKPFNERVMDAAIFSGELVKTTSSYSAVNIIHGYYTSKDANGRKINYGANAVNIALGAISSLTFARASFKAYNAKRAYQALQAVKASEVVKTTASVAHTALKTQKKISVVKTLKHLGNQSMALLNKAKTRATTIEMKEFKINNIFGVTPYFKKSYPRAPVLSMMGLGNLGIKKSKVIKFKAPILFSKSKTQAYYHQVRTNFMNSKLGKNLGNKENYLRQPTGPSRIKDYTQAGLINAGSQMVGHSIANFYDPNIRTDSEFLRAIFAKVDAVSVLAAAVTPGHSLIRTIVDPLVDVKLQGVSTLGYGKNLGAVLTDVVAAQTTRYSSKRKSVYEQRLKEHNQSTLESRKNIRAILEERNQQLKEISPGKYKALMKNMTLESEVDGIFNQLYGTKMKTIRSINKHTNISQILKIAGPASKAVVKPLISKIDLGVGINYPFFIRDFSFWGENNSFYGAPNK